MCREDDIAAFTRITHLIGEMSWDVGLPIDMPDGSHIIFDAIWHKVLDSPEYEPYTDLKGLASLQVKEIAELKKTVSDLEQELADTIKYHSQGYDGTL